MKTITKIEDKTDYNKIDKNIKYYIQRINKFDFVKTRLSCQGHFIKTPKPSVIYYTECECGDAMGCPTMSQIKSPYILLEFDNKYDRDTLFRLIICNRRKIYNIFTNARTDLYIITPRKEKTIVRIAHFSICVSRFNKKFISICYFITGKKTFEYEANKIAFNRDIKKIRKILFIMVISMLEFIEELRKD